MIENIEDNNMLLFGDENSFPMNPNFNFDDQNLIKEDKISNSDKDEEDDFLLNRIKNKNKNDKNLENSHYLLEKEEKSKIKKDLDFETKIEKKDFGLIIKKIDAPKLDSNNYKFNLTNYKKEIIPLNIQKNCKIENKSDQLGKKSIVIQSNLKITNNLNQNQNIIKSSNQIKPIINFMKFDVKPTNNQINANNQKQLPMLFNLKTQNLNIINSSVQKNNYNLLGSSNNIPSNKIVDKIHNNSISKNINDKFQINLNINKKPNNCFNITETSNEILKKKNNIESNSIISEKTDYSYVSEENDKQLKDVSKNLEQIFHKINENENISKIPKIEEKPKDLFKNNFEIKSDSINNSHIQEVKNKQINNLEKILFKSNNNNENIPNLNIEIMKINNNTEKMNEIELFNEKWITLINKAEENFKNIENSFIGLKIYESTYNLNINLIKEKLKTLKEISDKLKKEFSIYKENEIENYDLDSDFD